MTLMFDLAGKKVWVAGHRGMVGSAIVRRLSRESCKVVTYDIDCTYPIDVDHIYATVRPDAVIVAAARVGGILANSIWPADFLVQNLRIAETMITGASPYGVKLLFLGSSCIYPREAPQPMKEEYLLTGPLEPTNEWYALAKIAGIKLCQAYRRQYGCDFISVLPTNLYGPGDKFDPEHGHVIPALMAKMHAAKLNSLSSVEIWGTGEARREFLHVDDCADACVHLLKYYSDALPVNVGCGEDLSIAELAMMIRDIVGYEGDLVWDSSRPNGPPCKLLDRSRILARGWEPQIDLESGLRSTYEWYSQQCA